MGKMIALIVAATLVVAPLTDGVEAKKKKKKKPQKIERQISGTYDTPAPGIAGLVSVGNCGSPSTGCVPLSSGKGEKFLTLEIVDSSGQPATGALFIAEGGPYVTSFCGRTEEPISITPFTSYVVWVHNGPALDDPCPGIATQGTVQATFTNFR